MTNRASIERRGLRPALLVLLAASLVVVLGAQVPAPAGPGATPASTTEPLASDVQLCAGPADVVASESPPQDPTTGIESSVDAVAVPDQALAAAEVDGDPLLVLDGASTTVRGQSLGVATLASTVVTATGELAPGVAAEVSTTARDVRTSGLAAQACAVPARDWWFVAGSGQVGQRATLVLGNPAPSPAVVDVTVWTESGVLPGAGTNDLGIPPGDTRTVSLDAVAAGAERIGVRVTASVGRVAAAVGLRELDGADPVGLSWVAASQPPTRVSYVPGVPASGDRTLRLLNPGEDDALVALRALGEQGTFTPLGLDAVDVAAGQVVDVDLSPVGEEAFALEVSANVPVVSSVLARESPGDSLADFAVVSSAAPLDGPAATRVTSADKRATSVVLTAVSDPTQPTPELTPEVTAVTPDATAEATAATPGATQEATAATPEATPEATTTSSPTVEPSSQPPSTQVVLRTVSLQGTVLGAEVATVARGMTTTVPVELPNGVSDAWVVVVPVEPGVVLAARQTSATVRVPDALDPDSERDAYWYDLVALHALRTTVEVPPVLPDLTAGLPR